MVPQVRPLKGFTLAAVANIATGRPYTAVFDNTAPNFSMVPGEGFNSFRGPGVRDFDFSVARDVKVSERVRLRLKAEAFDLFNHPNFSSLLWTMCSTSSDKKPILAEISFLSGMWTLPKGTTGIMTTSGNLERSRRNMVLEISNSRHGLAFRTF